MAQLRDPYADFSMPAGVDPYSYEPGGWAGAYSYQPSGGYAINPSYDPTQYTTDMQSPQEAPPSQAQPQTLDPGPDPEGRTKVPTHRPPQAPTSEPPPVQAAPAYQPAEAPVLPSHAGLDARLKSIFDSGGEFNQGIVNRRTENARENLGRQRKSTLNNDRAYLADRGLIGSGPEATAVDLLDQNISDKYANAVSGIYANESENADQRMIQALQQAVGLSESDAANIVNSFSASTARTLGLGNLALGNSKNANDYNLGLGQLGLNRDVALNNADNAQVDQLIQLLQQLYGGANTSSQGYY